MSFSQALSGLAAQSESLKVIGNNIANSQTVGFKSGSAAFSDVFAGANSKVGLGTRVAAVVQNFESGDLESTGRNLDLAIAGNGFYRLEQPNGEVVYSRNGQIGMNSEGYLVNAAGQYLTGYGVNEADPNDPGTVTEIVATNPSRIQVPSGDFPAKQTNEVRAVYNLDASLDHTDAELRQQASVFDDVARGVGDQVEIDYHYSNSYAVFDSLGNARNVTVYFEKTGENAWTARTAIDGYYDNNNNFSLSFDSNGQLDKQPNAQGQDFIVGVDDGSPNNKTGAPAGNGDDKAALTFPSENGAGVIGLDFFLSGTTQYSGDSTQSSLSQNGYASGSLAGVSVDKDGVIYRNYTNEQSVPAGQIVLTSFANEEGLQPVGDNAWRQTTGSGEPVIGVAGTGVFGTIESGTLENSNVDLAKQLVDMIVAQRAYQANSSSIGTQDELLQTVINL